MWRMLLGLLLVFARGEGPNSCSMIGHVSDEFRVSIAGATVSIRSAFSSDVQSTKTDENRDVQAFWIAAGETLRVRNRGWVFVSVGFQCFTASSGGDAFGLHAAQIKKRTGIERFAD